jgi:hypothetical protein
MSLNSSTIFGISVLVILIFGIIFFFIYVFTCVLIKYEPDEVELDKLLKEYKKNRLKDRFSK